MKAHATKNFFFFPCDIDGDTVRDAHFNSVYAISPSIHHRGNYKVKSGALSSSPIPDAL